MYKYYLFISYSRRDSRAAAYLQRQLEHFRVPIRLVPQENLPEDGKFLRPVFRDRRDLKNTEKSFTADIQVALEQSRYLLVLCSQNSSESKWVDEEIRHFLKTHDGDYAKVVPVILSGRPNSSGTDECLPSELRLEQITSRNLPSMIPDDGEGEKAGWENGVVQSLSYMLKVEREKIKASVDRERLRQTRIYAAIGICAAIVFALMAMWAVHEMQIAERNRLEAERNWQIAERNRKEAELNLERAIAGETLAKENETKAKANEAKAKENEARAVDSEMKERRQAEIAMKSLDFLRDMFSGNKEQNAGNRRVKDVLVSKVLDIEKITPDVLRASVSEVVGGLLVENSIYPPAKGLLEYAVQFYEKEGNLPRLKSAYNKLGIYYSFMGDFESAKRYYLQTLKEGEDAVIYENLADNALRAGNYGETEEFARKAIEIAQRQYGEENVQTLDCMLQLGKVYFDKDELVKLEALLRQVETALSHTGHLKSSTYLTTCNLFGNLYIRQNKTDEALEYYQKALRLTIEFFGESSIHTTSIYNNIGHLYIIREDYYKAMENLEKGLSIITEIHSDGSATEGQICNNIGMTLLNMKNNARALEYLNRSLELRRRFCGEKHPDTGETLINLAYYFDLTADVEKAIDYNNQALKAYMGSSGDNTSRVATIYNNLGEIYRKKGDFIMAIQQYEKALGIDERIIGKEKMNQDLATVHNNLALAYFSLNNREEALKHISLAVDFAQNNLPPGHELRRLYMKNKASFENSAVILVGGKSYVDEQDKINQETNVAKSYLDKVDEDPANAVEWLEKADKSYRQILEYYIRVQKAETPEAAIVYNQLGYIKKKRNQKRDAMQLYLKSLNINEKLNGVNHVETMVNYNNLFNCCMDDEEYLEAVKWGKRYIDASLARKQEDRTLAVIYNNMAFCHGKLHNVIEEEKCYQEALRIHLSLGNKDLVEISTAYVNLGAVYSGKGEYEKSLESYKKGIEIQENIKDFPLETLGLNYNNMALIADNLGDKEQACRYLKKALDINLAIRGGEDLEVATNYMNLALCLKDMKKYRDAVEMAEKAVKIRKMKLGEEHKSVFFGYNQLGILYNSLGEVKRSLEFHEKALESALKIWGEEHNETSTCYGNIADCHLQMKNYKSAKEAAEKALDIERLLNGEDRKNILSRYFMLGRIYEECDYFVDSLFNYKKCASLALLRQDVTDDKKLEYVVKASGSYQSLAQREKNDEYKSMQELLNSYLEVYPKTKSRDMHSSLLRECVKFYMAYGRMEQAEESYRADLALYDVGIPAEQAEISISHFVMATVCYAKSLYQEAIPYYKMALKTDLARDDTPWDDVRIDYLHIADCYYEIGKYAESYEYYEKALTTIHEKNLKDDSVEDYKSIMKKCREFVAGKRIVFCVSKLFPGENGEKAGIMVEDVFLSLEGWSVKQMPKLPHKSSGDFLKAVNAVGDKEKEIVVARRGNGTFQPLTIHCPKGPIGVEWRFDYVLPEQYEEYVKLLDKKEGQQP